MKEEGAPSLVLDSPLMSAADEDRTFDYVIVGSGPSAMGILLGLLSPFKGKAPPFTIAVIERGHGDPAEKTRHPNRWYAAAHSESSSVHIHQGQVRGRIFDVPVGKGLGGSSNINACLFTPPARQDFDAWPEPWRSKLMASVRFVQDEFSSNGCVYSSNAAQGTQLDQGSIYPPISADSKSADPITWRETTFPSRAVQIPCTASVDSQGQLRRRNYYNGLVEPLLRQHAGLSKAVHWFCGYEAQRLLFSGNKVAGVECKRQESLGFVDIHASKEVILSAGAIESPVLLLASGIGRKEDLEHAGIPVRDPNFQGGVGRNLRDHVMLLRAVLTLPCRDALSLSGVKALFQVSLEGSHFQIAVMDASLFADVLPRALVGLFRWRFTDHDVGSKGLAALANHVSFAFNRVLTPILCFVFSLAPVLWLLRLFVSAVGVFLLNPESKGSVRVRKVESLDLSPVRREDLNVDIDLGYLEDERDVKALVKGWIAADDIVERLGGIEAVPGPLIRRFSDYRLDWSWFKRFATASFVPYFHWCGTCTMSTDQESEGGVVDSQLRVERFECLRVCDASVFPTTISGPTALTCASVGHLFGSSLAKVYE